MGNAYVKENLPKVLKHVFADDFSPSNKRILTDLLMLVSYYAEEDFSEDLLQSCNRLRAVLIQIEQLESIMERISMISNYHCDFSNDPSTQVAPNYTFSPQFPNITDICFALSEKVETIKIELSEIDSMSLCMYVRKKAVAAGDL